MKILNLTQHAATPDQIEAGVFEPREIDRELIRGQLTFAAIPDALCLRSRARYLAQLAARYKTDDDVLCVMIGGAPFFMEWLAEALRALGMKPCYAFSKRESVEQKMDDGSVRKTQVFRHEGFVWG
jgi:hypothetical protein